MIDSTCFATSGPGSITATSSMPTRYVFVPGPVMRLGLFATTRRISGESALGTSGVIAGTRSSPSPHVRSVGTREDVGERDRPRRRRRDRRLAGARLARRFRRSRRRVVRSRRVGTASRSASSSRECVVVRERCGGSSRSGRSDRCGRRACWASASTGRTHADATSSLSSCVPSSPSGAGATKNHVLYRRGAPSGVSQCENTRSSRASSTRSRVTSSSPNARPPAFSSRRAAASAVDRAPPVEPVAASSASRIPASSKHSRTAATRSASPPRAIPWAALARGVVETDDPLGQAGRAVGGIDGSTREDRRAGPEHRPVACAPTSRRGGRADPKRG